jgi:hypothetical protein
MSQMLRWAATWILAPAMLSFVGCGGGSSPAAPPPVAATPAPTPTPVPTPVALDGLSHEMVVEATITPTTPGLRDAVSVRAPGFLVREQPYDGGPIYLWKVEEDYVNALVYPLTFTDGSFRMIRWAGGFTLTLEQGLDENETVMRKTQEVVAEVRRHTGLPITIGPNGAVRVVIDSAIRTNDSLVGQAIRSFQGATIVGGTMKFASVQDLLGTNRADYTNVYLHEMGHVMGLGHSPLTREIMTAGGGARITLGEFQPREALALHMMYQHRLAGNFAPDRDGALGRQSTARPTTTVIDN